MTGRDFLYRVSRLDAIITVKNRLLEKYVARQGPRGARAASYDSTGVHGGCSQSSAETVVNTLSCLRDEILALKAEISRAVWLIGKLQDLRENEILTLRYLLHESYEGIAEKMGYSLRHVFKLHKTAMENFEKIYAANANERQ